MRICSSVGSNPAADGALAARFVAFLAGAFFAFAGARRGVFSVTPLASVMPFDVISVSLLDVLVFLGTGKSLNWLRITQVVFSAVPLPFFVKTTKRKNDSHLGH